MITKAIQLAAEVHDGQTDKGGEPYIFHALTVMRMVGERTNHMRFVAENFRQDAMIVAVLHDAIEDYEGPAMERVRMTRYIEETFGLTVMSALWAMTHGSTESYEAYIERVAADPIATLVKICDLTHNMDPRRMPNKEIGTKEFERWDKYRKSLVRLEREMS